MSRSQKSPRCSSAPAATPGIHPRAIVAAGARSRRSAARSARYCVIDKMQPDRRRRRGRSTLRHRRGCVVGAQSRLIARVTLVPRVTLGQARTRASRRGDRRRRLWHRDRSTPAQWRMGQGAATGWRAHRRRLRNRRQYHHRSRRARATPCSKRTCAWTTRSRSRHNVLIGAHTAMAGCSAVAGSAQHRPLLPDRRRCWHTWPLESGRPSHRDRDDPGHPFDPRSPANIRPARRCRTIARGVTTPHASSDWMNWPGASAHREGPQAMTDTATLTRRRCRSTSTASSSDAAASLSVPAGRSGDRVRAGESADARSRT